MNLSEKLHYDNERKNRKNVKNIDFLWGIYDLYGFITIESN